MPDSFISRWLPLGGLILAAWLAIYLVRAPSPVRANAPATSFSAERALREVNVIARQPHSIGTPANAAVRDYLVQRCRALGLRTRVQDTTVMTGAGGMLTEARVQNVVAWLPGRISGSKSVLVLAHYDSQPHTFGASDDGAGVAAALETMRALRAAPPLPHSVLWVFTDGEEVGLLGARAYAADTARLRRTVGVVLNFEARGNSGASSLFEVSPNNGWLLTEFAKAVPVAIGSSLAYEIYRYLPNTTDFTAFRAAGLPGLNFAFSDGYSYYHSSADTPGHLSLASLQHQGDYMLPLVRHFASISLSHAPTPNSTFFNPLGTWLVLYSAYWNYLLTFLGWVLLVVAVSWARQRGRLRIAGLLGGLVVWVGGLLLVLAAGWALTQLVAITYPQYAVFYDQAFYNVHYYHVALIALGLAVFGAYYSALGRHVRADSLSGGALLLLAVLQTVVQLQAPSSSFLLGFPLVCGGLSWLWSLAQSPRPLASSAAAQQASPRRLQLGQWLLALPVVFLIAPTLSALLTLAGLGPLVMGAMLLLTMLLGLLLPTLLPLLACSNRRVNWRLPILTTLLAVGMLAAGHASSQPTAEHPQQAHLYYLLDADHSRGYWLSGSPHLNDWTRQLFRTPVFSSLPALLPGSTQPVLQQAAPALPLAPAAITVLSDSSLPGGRHLRLWLRPGRPGVVSMRLNWQANRLRQLLVDSHQVEPSGLTTSNSTLALTLFAPGPKGIILELTTTDAQPLAILVTDRSLNLPAIAGIPPLPATIISAPGYSSFTTQVAKQFTL
jgi:hypothetical protein